MIIFYTNEEPTKRRKKKCGINYLKNFSQGNCIEF